MSAVLTFLGSSDSQGVPRWWCGCRVCEEARAGGLNRRTRPSVLVEGAGERILVDAAPELRLQLGREGVRDVGALIVTHAHNDHLLGLGDVADQARWTERPTPVYAPAEVLPQVIQRFAYLGRGRYPQLVPMAALERTGRTFAGYRASAHRVPHGFNGFAYGLRCDGPRGSWAYVPDSLGLTDLSPWRGLELLVLGTSFYREAAPYERRSVYDVTEALALLSEIKPARTVFTHLGHGIDARKPSPQGTTYARDGLRLELP